LGIYDRMRGQFIAAFTGFSTPTGGGDAQCVHQNAWGLRSRPAQQLPIGWCGHGGSLQWLLACVSEAIRIRSRKIQFWSWDHIFVGVQSQFQAANPRNIEPKFREMKLLSQS